MTKIRNITNDYSLSASDNNALFLVDNSQQNINLYLPYALDLVDFEIKKTNTGSNDIFLHAKGLDTFENDANLFVLSGASTLIRAKIVSSNKDKWWISSDGEDNVEFVHEPIVFAAVASGPPGQAPILTVVGNTILGLQMTSGSHAGYRTFKIPATHLSMSTFHIHWTRSTTGNDLNKAVRWKITYKIFDGISNDASGSETILEYEDTYDSSSTTDKIIYRTPNLTAPGFIPNYYVGIKVQPIGTSGSALSSPILISLDLIHDKKIHKA